MKIIAHRINNPQKTDKAINYGVDFLEVDVSQRALIPKFIAAHNFLAGKLGFGPLLETIFNKSTKDRLFLDIKFANRNFAKRFSKFINSMENGKIKICGRDWKVISQICHLHGFEAYYTIRDEEAWQRFKETLPFLKKPHGFSIRYSLIDQNLIEEIRNITRNAQIWAWVVNSNYELIRLKRLKIDGVITDNWQRLPI